MEENRGISRGEGSGREGELLSPAAPLYRASPGHRRLPEAKSQDLLPLSGSLPLDCQHSAVFAHLLGSSIFLTRPRLWGICLCLCHFWNLLYIFLCLFSDSHSSLPWHLPPHTFFLTTQTSLQLQVRNSLLLPQETPEVALMQNFWWNWV